MLRKGSVSRIEMDGLVFDVELEVDTRRSSFKKKRKKKKKAGLILSPVQILFAGCL